MEVLKIDHIHFKTNDIERDTSLFEDLLGKKFPVKADLSTTHGVRFAFLAPPLGFNLVEVTDKDKEMSQLYVDKPDGIFCIALKVTDIEKATAEMESMGYKTLIRSDHGPLKEAMFDTKNAFSLYIELVEYPGESVLDLADEASKGFDSFSMDQTS